jgi:hypothetical protein
MLILQSTMRAIIIPLAQLGKKKGGPLSLHEATSHWLHGTSIPNIGLPLFLAWTNSPS